MFDFEKLDVYKKAKAFNSKIREFLKTTKLDTSTNDQLRRAAFSVVLNLAEGSGRFTNQTAETSTSSPEVQFLNA